MPPKRKHTKTRTGCKTCRVRRIKCDEQRPKCRNCTRREVECAYFKHPESSQPSGVATQDLVLSSDNGGRVEAGGPLESQGSLGSAQVHSSSSLFLPLPRLSLPEVELEMENLELLHHFTTVTYMTITLDSEIMEFWRLKIPKIALSYEFVMHALLATSALHLSFLRSSDETFARAAERHHENAVASMKIALTAKHLPPGDAIYAGNTLASRYAYSRLPPAEYVLPTAPLWIPVLRGVFKTTRQFFERIKGGVLLPLVASKMNDNCPYPGEHIEFPSSLFDLSKRGISGGLDPEEDEDDQSLEIYHETTTALQLFWNQYWLVTARESVAFSWPATMSEGYERLISQQRPRALVILAHHCVLVESLGKEFWWAKGRGVDEIKRIEGVLEEKWKHWLDWPMAKCKILKETV